MEEDLRCLAQALGHEFRSPALLQQALTHRSTTAENNERLEFLGDALLDFVIAEALWARFPRASEGHLTRRRATLVKKESLAELARALRLGDYLYLGSGEVRTGGHTRESILADALEAVFAAVYLDQGFAAARRVILACYRGLLEDLVGEEPLKDPKTRLQEWLQADKRPLPLYEVLEIAGSPHEQSFLVRCSLTDSAQETQGQGRSRRGAEQQAAAQMLEVLDQDG